MVRMFHVKRKAKKPNKKALNPEQIAEIVGERLGPTLAGIGVIAKNHEFLARIVRMAATLATWGPKINLTANPRNPDEILFHVFDSIIPLSIVVSARILRWGAGGAGGAGLDRERRFLDVGSGAGFPGLVLAAAVNAQVTLVEARRKRATYLNEAAVEMGLRNVKVENARVESLNYRDRFDLITARAVGKPIEIFKVAGASLHPGGVLMLYVSADQKFDDSRIVSAAAEAGLSDATISGYDLRHGKQVMRRAVATWVRR
jgi:16S rRNA (guanine(527)-N(7))-methyltransferase RsmG